MADEPTLLNFDALPAPKLLDFEKPAANDGGITQYNADGWYSALTGLGTPERDKRLSHSYSTPCIGYGESIQLWRGDDMAKAAIEKPVNQCFRQGYEIEIPDEGNYADLRVDLEEALLDLGADDCIARAMHLKRALGGGAIWIGADDGRPQHLPLIPERVRSIDWLKVLEPIELTPYTVYSDPYKAKFGEPELFQFNEIQGFTANSLVPPATSTKTRRGPSGLVLIHESRLILFPGTKVSNYQTTTGSLETSSYWGDSILMTMIEVLRDFNIAWHSAGIIASDYAQSVIKIQNLMGLVANQKEQLRARMQALELGRSVARAIILDTNEEYERQSTSLAGLPELLEKLSRRLAAAVGMPLSILMGAGEMGIGKDGLSDVRHYYDGIAAMQRCEVTPVLRRIIKLIMGTLRKRKVPRRWNIKYNPLWQLTDQEKAEARLTQARADALYVKMLAVSPDEIRDSRFRGGFSFDTQINESQHSQDMNKAKEIAEKVALMALEVAKIKPVPGTGGTTVTAHKRGAPTGGGGDVGGQSSGVKEGGDVSGSGSNSREP